MEHGSRGSAGCRRTSVRASCSSPRPAWPTSWRGSASGWRRSALTAEAFRIAPRDLARRLNLRQTVDLVRIATDVFEQHLPPLAADEAERRALVEGVLRFGREIAFAAATVYAGAAETRGAWDARLEALVVDAVVRGPGAESGSTRAQLGRRAWSPAPSALGWDPTAPVRVVVGSPAPEAPAELLSELRHEADRSGQSVLVGVQGSRLVVLLSEPARPRHRRRHRHGRRGVRIGPGGRRARAPLTCPARTPAPAMRSPACGRHRAGRTRPARSRPTTCCPSARWPATRSRTAGWSTPSSTR